jgi:hypothetical protein
LPQPTLFKQPKVDKELKPGKILIITHKHHYNKLGIILSVATQSHKESLYKVLVLEDQQTSDDSSVTKNNLVRTTAFNHVFVDKCLKFKLLS